MKRILVVATVICSVLLSGCYVSTSVKVRNRHLPADFSAEILVVTVEEKAGLGQHYLVVIEQNVLEALTAKGINSITLNEAVAMDKPERAMERLLSNDYRALLKVVIDDWGSKTEILQDQVPTTVDSSDTGPAAGSSFRSPSDYDSDATVRGPESSYKEVSMAWYLTDLRSSRLIWSAQVSARPAVVGRSFLYHRFNRNLEYEELARRCYKKLAGKLASAWPKESGEKK